MKITIKTFTWLMILTLNSFAQHSLTNTYTGELGDPNYIEMALLFIPNAYNVRICFEVEPHDLETIPTITVTNATLAQTFDSIFNLHTNYMWRYENQTESYYVYPKTNAVTMMRFDPISVTNVQFHSFFYDKDYLGFKNLNLKFAFHHSTFYFWDKPVSLDFQNAFVWQIFDALCKQLPYVNFWILRSSGYVE